LAHKIAFRALDGHNQLIIPPHRASPSSGFRATSHFPSSCIDEKGFTIFQALLHAHTSGRSLRLRHFRQGEELPWILHDDFYDFEYQQTRNLDKPIKVLPGDYLVMECDYAMVEDVSFEEMCAVELHVYTESNKKPKFLYSLSWMDLDRQLRVLGITNYTKSYDGDLQVKVMIHEPEKYAGELRDVLNHKFNWTPKIFRKLQQLYTYGAQNQVCSEVVRRDKRTDLELLNVHTVSMPVSGLLNPYKMPNVCEPQDVGSDAQQGTGGFV